MEGVVSGWEPIKAQLRARCLRYPELRDAGSAEGPSNMRTRQEERAA
jgi:hypothetical protein